MTPLDIDFRPSFPWRKFIAWAVLTALILSSCAAGWKLWTVRTQTEELSRLNGATLAAVRSLEARKRAAQVKPPYLDALDELVRISTFPLDEAVTALERIDVPGTRVVDLAIDAAEHRAIAVVEASSPEALQAYLEGLAVEGNSGSWRLQLISSGAMSQDGATDRSLSTTGSSPSGTALASQNAAATSLRATLKWQH